MKETIKLSDNVEFDVLYADREKHHVSEGILFEINKDGSVIMHFGTSRPECILAVCDAMIEMMDDIIILNGEKE